jgi:predicted DNA-binding transcriptional regulator AlpA
MSENRLLTREEVMQRLQMKASHFSKVVNGKIKGLPPLAVVAIGRLQRFRIEAVEDWVKEVEKKRCNGAH